MNTSRLDFEFTDRDIVTALLAETPPDGIAIDGSDHPTIRATSGADITFSISVHLDPVYIGALSVWLAAVIGRCISKRCGTHARINNKQVEPKPEELDAVIREQIRWQRVRESQWQERQQNIAVRLREGWK